MDQLVVPLVSVIAKHEASQVAIVPVILTKEGSALNSVILLYEYLCPQEPSASDIPHDDRVTLAYSHRYYVK